MTLDARDGAAASVPGFWAGVDIGGTKLAAGVVRFPEGRVLVRHEVACRPAAGREAVLTDLRALLASLRACCDGSAREWSGVGFGICELVDRESRVASASLFDLRDPDYWSSLAQGLPWRVESDVRAAALAEARFGAGRGCASFLYVTIGTGISCCLLSNGAPLLGATGATGTFASSPLPDFLGLAGGAVPPSLEALSSGPALAARCRQAGLAVADAREVLALASNGEPRSGEVVRAAARALGAGVGWLVNTLDPERVIIGGGLGLAPGLYRDTLIESTRRHIWAPSRRSLPMLPAETGADAGVIGAALQARGC